MVKIKAWLLSIGLSVCAMAQAQGESGDDAMMKRATEIGTFFQQNNAQGVVAYTDDAVINLLGRDQFYAVTRSAMDGLKSEHVVLEDIQLQTPSAEIQGQNRVFRLIPKLQNMSMNGQKAQMKGFLLAIKNSDGVWKFVEGSGLVKNPQFRARLYPDLPPNLPLPEVKLEVLYGSP